MLPLALPRGSLLLGPTCLGRQAVGVAEDDQSPSAHCSEYLFTIHLDLHSRDDADEVAEVVAPDEVILPPSAGCKVRIICVDQGVVIDDT